MLIGLIQQELCQRETSLTSHDIASEWSCSVNDELSLEYLAVDNRSQGFTEIVAYCQQLLRFNL